MITTSKQLKDRIRNLAKKDAADAQILMRTYMAERFLERVSLSAYRDKVILKGGMLVADMVGLGARSTMDLDATIKGTAVSVADVEKMMSEILAVPIEDGVQCYKIQMPNVTPHVCRHTYCTRMAQSGIWLSEHRQYARYGIPGML